MRLISKGFTLLEVLLVVLLMGLVATTVVLNFNKPSDEILKKSITQFIGVLNRVQDESIFSGNLYGLKIDKTKYQVMEYKKGHWVDVKKDFISGSYTLPEELSLKLDVDKMPLEQEDKDNKSLFDDSFSLNIDKEEVIPEIFVFPSGELTSFSLQIFMKKVELSQKNITTRAFITGDNFGQVTVDEK